MSVYTITLVSYLNKLLNILANGLTAKAANRVITLRGQTTTDNHKEWIKNTLWQVSDS